MDTMVLATQEWLNETYGNDSRFNKLDLENKKIKGKTGWPTIYALTRALQIELGITNTADNFGPTTQSLFKTVKMQTNPSPENNINAIIQGALWCKGYSTGSYEITGNFYEGTAAAIIKLKKDAGLISPNSDVTLNVMKALLSMDAFVCIPGGSEKIRSIQQELNRNYEDYIGLMPCDGVYGRNTNRALIYALQAEEGLSPDDANGYCGPYTRNNCPILPDTNHELTIGKRERFTKILQQALICNGFTFCYVTGEYDKNTESEIVRFQQVYKLPVTGVANLTTWLSLLTSCGDVTRDAEACDCATILTAEKAATLRDKGYRIVCRYLTGHITVNGQNISKALSLDEINIILNAGLRFVPIYQTSANYKEYFSASQGKIDADAALKAAESLNIPEDTIIYFAVDFDATENEMDIILEHFKAIKEAFNDTLGRSYKIGIYASRNICTQVSEAGYATSSFVSDMSTGFSGNLGFKIPSNWAFDQFHTTTIGSGNGQIEIDKDGYSGRDPGVSRLQTYENINGVGNGIIKVNRSGIPIRVFRRKVKNGGISNTLARDEFDCIPNNAFFVYKKNYELDSEGEPIPGSTSSSDGTYRVIFTNSAGNQCEGYVSDGILSYQGDNYEEIAMAWKNTEDFAHLGVNTDINAIDPLITLNQTVIEDKKYYIFTLSNSSDYYDYDDERCGTLSAGTQIAIAAGAYSGRKYPWRIHVDKVKVNNEWVSLCTVHGGFLDLRFDLGNQPHNRLLR